MKLAYALLTALILYGFLNNSQAASSAYIAGEQPSMDGWHKVGSARPQVKAWHPRFPDAKDVDTYCAVYAGQMLYGIGAWFNADDSMHSLSLVIIQKTKEEYTGHEDELASMPFVEGDDGKHAVVWIMTSGTDEEHGYWELEPDTLETILGAMQAGWQWANNNEEIARNYRYAPREMWHQYMWNFCKDSMKGK